VFDYFSMKICILSLCFLLYRRTALLVWIFIIIISCKLDNWSCYFAGRIKFLLNVKKYPGVVNVFSSKRKLNYMTVDSMWRSRLCRFKDNSNYKKKKMPKKIKKKSSSSSWPIIFVFFMALTRYDNHVYWHFFQQNLVTWLG
jgi:hypothetical protein